MLSVEEHERQLLESRAFCHLALLEECLEETTPGVNLYARVAVYHLIQELRMLFVCILEDVEYTPSHLLVHYLTHNENPYLQSNPPDEKQANA